MSSTNAAGLVRYARTMWGTSLTFTLRDNACTALVLIGDTTMYLIRTTAGANPVLYTRIAGSTDVTITHASNNRTITVTVSSNTVLECFYIA